VEKVDVILETVGLTKFFGMVRAAKDLNIRIAEKELVGIVGPNGSGKTTLLNLVTGYLKPDEGAIRYTEKDITGLPPRTVASLGIARSFQSPQLFPELTVTENLLLALAIRGGKALDFWGPLHREDRAGDAVEILTQFYLENYGGQQASQLPAGQRKLLDIAISFARRPNVLLMDEPTSGVSAKDKFRVMDTLVEVLKGSGVTTVFVEHDMEVVQRYAERVLVFDEGTILADGSPHQVFEDDAVKEFLLGVE
jgi:branched-chain amino acid transport system ATP-binding protein